MQTRYVERIGGTDHSWRRNQEANENSMIFISFRISKSLSILKPFNQKILWPESALVSASINGMLKNQEETRQCHQQMCQKIVQLTRVVHRLNVMHQERDKEMLEREMQAQDCCHGEELSLVENDAQNKICHLRNELGEKNEFIHELLQQQEEALQRLVQERKMWEIKFEKELDQLRSDLEVELVCLSGKYESIAQEAKEVDNKIIGLQNEHQKEMLSTCVENKNLRNLFSNSNLQYSEERSKLVTMYQERISSLTFAKDKYVQDLSAQLKLAATVKVQHESTIKRLEEEFNSTRKNLQEEWEIQLTNHLVQKETELKREDDRFRSELELKEMGIIKLQQIIAELNKEVRDMQKRHDKRLQGSREEQNDLRKLLADRDEYTSQLKNILSNKDKEIKGLSNEKVVIMSQYKTSNDRIISLQSTLSDGENRIRAMQIKLDQMVANDVRIRKQQQIELSEKDAKLASASTEISLTNKNLKDWKIIVQEMKKSLADLKDDYINKVKMNGLHLLTHIKEILCLRIASFRKEFNSEIEEIRMKESWRFQAEKNEHDRLLKSAIEENHLKLVKMESEYKNTIAALQTRIHESQCEIVSITKTAEKRLEEQESRSLKDRQTSEAISDAERTNQRQREQVLLSDLNSKWEHRYKTLQNSHAQKIQNMLEETQVIHKMYESHAQRCSDRYIASINELRHQIGHVGSSIKTLDNLYQNILEENTRQVKIDFDTRYAGKQQDLVSKLRHSDEEVSRVNEHLKKMKADLQCVKIELCVEKQENCHLKEKCDTLLLELEHASEKSEQVLAEVKSKCMRNLHGEHEKEMKSLEMGLRLQHEEEKKRWKALNANLEEELDNRNHIIATKTEREEGLKESMQQLNNELNETKILWTNERNDKQNKIDTLNLTVKETEHKFFQMQEIVRVEQEEQIKQLRHNLEIAKVEVSKSEAVIQSLKIAALTIKDEVETEKIQMLKNELAQSKQREKQSASDMHYFKSELKNREDNFNSRFTASNDSIATLTTFKRPSTTNRRMRHGKENRKNDRSRNNIY